MSRMLTLMLSAAIVDNVATMYTTDTTAKRLMTTTGLESFADAVDDMATTSTKGSTAKRRMTTACTVSGETVLVVPDQRFCARDA
jgi:hypothetical protein